MDILNKELKRKIIDISYYKKLSHIGSCITAVDILAHIYMSKKKDDKVILSSGHAGLALYVVLEEFYSMKRGYYGVSAVELFDKHGVHPNRDIKSGIEVSSGSLGQACTVALGIAIARPDIHIYCVLSDGELAEGSVWETLENAFTLGINNITFYINCNGYGAYKPIWLNRVLARLVCYTNALKDESMIKIVESDPSYIPFLKGIDAHYVIMDDDMYKLALDSLK